MGQESHRHIFAGTVGLAVLAVGFVSYLWTPPPVSGQKASSVTLTLLTDGLVKPVHAVQPPGDHSRMFVVEKIGRIRLLKDGALLAQPFLDIRNLVAATGVEQGLLSMAFHPDYAKNGFFYVAYSGNGGRNLIVDRYRIGATLDQADPASRTQVISIPHPTYPIHYGGMLVFGPDGYLYISVGDGGSPLDANNNAQQLTTWLGKILRIDVNTLPYRVPPTNPLVGSATARPEIWASGLRNPWRISFDRATGELYITDVGQDRFEEINVEPPGFGGGRNYGWRLMEAFQCYDPKPCDPAGLTTPAFAYAHDNGNCAVIGGYVYQGTRIPAMVGSYVYGDYCTGQLWLLRNAPGGWGAAFLANTPLPIGGFGQDEQGELYVLDVQGGALYRIDPAAALTPIPSGTPTSTATLTRTTEPVPSRVPSGTPTQSQTPTGTTTATPTRSPTASMTPVLVGGSGFSLRGPVPQLHWADGTTETGYILLRWSPPGTVVLRPPSGALGPNVTTFTDDDQLTGDAYCYKLVTAGGSPPSLDQILRQSDLLCILPRTATGASPIGVTIMTRPGGITGLTWQGSGVEDSYAVIRVTFDGAGPQTSIVAGAVREFQDPTGGAPTCYFVAALRKGVPLGSADGLCSVAEGGGAATRLWYTDREIPLP